MNKFVFLHRHDTKPEQGFDTDLFLVPVAAYVQDIKSSYLDHDDIIRQFWLDFPRLQCSVCSSSGVRRGTAWDLLRVPSFMLLSTQAAFHLHYVTAHRLHATAGHAITSGKSHIVLPSPGCIRLKHTFGRVDITTGVVTGHIHTVLDLSPSDDEALLLVHYSAG